MEAEIIKKQYCPICSVHVEVSERYPNYVCSDCAKKAKSESGSPLQFYNEGFGGGFVAIFADTNEKYDSHFCFIDDVRCIADEARFGGIVIQPIKLNMSDRIAGALVGLLVGDALGVPYEFHEPQSIPPFEEIEFEPPVNFRRAHLGVPAGTWSDDGAQALCLLASLLECEIFDVDDFSEKLVAWFREDYMAVDDVFDVGIQTQRAILNLRKGIPPLEAGLKEAQNNGNGSLMRVLPLALWHQGSNEELVQNAFAQSAVTHGHLRSKLCCAIYCLWARQILRESENAWENAISAVRATFPKNSLERIELEQQIKPDDIHGINGSGYVLDSLFSAKWACEKKSFEEIVKAAIALGNDTDTTACIAGGIAGLKFGLEGIPIRWRESLRGQKIYQPLLDRLIAMQN